jgi:hypothetical protein
MLDKIKMRTIAFRCLLAITGSDRAFLLVAQQGTVQETPQEKPQPQPSSMAETQTVLFDGRVFYLKSDKHRLKGKIYDYFPPNESPSNFTGSIGLRVESKLLTIKKSANHAAQAAWLLNFLYPSTKCAIETNDKIEEAFLECGSFLKDQNVFDFHIFKFYTLTPDNRVLEFRYVKEVKGADGKTRTYSDVDAEIAALREKIRPMMREFPL